MKSNVCFCHILQLLPEEELALALHNFVEKDEKGALAECVNAELQARLHVAAERGAFKASTATKVRGVLLAVAYSVLILYSFSR